MNIENDLLDNDRADSGTQLSHKAMSDLHTTSKWTHFLSILGFIGLGLIVIAALFILSGSLRMRSDQRIIMGFGYLIMVGIYFFPIYFLTKFSIRVKEAMVTNPRMNLEEAIKYLKMHYKFIGIFTIVIVSLYILAALIGIGYATSISRF